MYRWIAYSMSFAYLSKAPEVLLVLESRAGGTSVLTEVKFAALDLLVFQLSQPRLVVWIVRKWYLDWQSHVIVYEILSRVSTSILHPFEA